MKSKYLVVYRGKYLNKGIRTEFIYQNFDIINKAEFLFNFSSTLPTPKVLAIFFTILQYHLYEVQ